MNYGSMSNSDFIAYAACFPWGSVHDHPLFDSSAAVYFYTSIVTPQYGSVTDVAIVTNTHITYQYRVFAYVSVFAYLWLSVSETTHHLPSPIEK
jgi:hypothetical protein